MTNPNASSRSVEIDSPARHAVGHVIGGKYVLERRLGEGHNSGVWRARNMALGSGVALKLLQGVLRTPESVAQLLCEARLEASLQQPGVVRVFDVEQSEHGDAFIAMELLEGQTLAALLEQHGPLGAVEAARMLLPVIAVLVAVHAKGMAHGNLDAANIILVPLAHGLRPTLIDFGCMEHPSRTLGSALATGCDSDVLAIRRILHEAVAGRAPLDDLLGPGSTSMRELGVSLAQLLLARGVGTDASGTEVAEAWLRSKPSCAGTTSAGSDRSSAGDHPAQRLRGARDQISDRVEHPPA